MDHIGTRAEHLADLYDLWSSGHMLFSRKSYPTEYETVVMDELNTCMRYLAAYMQKDYNASSYAREINNLGSLPPGKDDESS